MSFLSHIKSNPTYIWAKEQARPYSYTERVLVICATHDELESCFTAVQTLYPNHSVSLVNKDEFALRVDRVDYLFACVGFTYFNAPNIISLVRAFEPTEVINVGTCAGLSANSKLFDIIISNNFKSIDLDITAFGYEDGSLIKKGETQSSVGPLVLSGSHFLATKEEKDSLLQRFPDAVAMDMETYMFKRICDALGVPFTTIRCVSDIGEETPDKSYSDNASDAGVIAALTTLLLVQDYPVRKLKN